MKKSIMIPIILSLVIAAGNISSTSVLAAESAVQAEEAILSEEGSEIQEEMPEAAGEDAGLTTETAAETEEAAAVAEAEEDPAVKEIAEDAEPIETGTEAENSIEDGYRDAEPIKVSEVKGVHITQDQPVQFFKFEAERTALYELSSIYPDTMANLTLYNSSLDQTGCYHDYGGERDPNEYIRFFAKKGDILYIEATLARADELEGNDSLGCDVVIDYLSSGKTARGDMFNLADDVKVTWKEVPGAEYYKIYREGVTDSRETRKEPVIVTSELIGWDKAPGLTNGHAYRYKIVASLSEKGDSSYDSPRSYSKLMYRLKTVVIRSVKNTVPGGVTVKYDKTTSGDSYVLQYSENQDMRNAQTRVIKGADTTSYTIGGLKKGKTYYISIRVRKKVDGINYYTTFGVPKKITITR